MIKPATIELTKIELENQSKKGIPFSSVKMDGALSVSAEAIK
jgi:hypothetical protein